jgi:hypothetical protein
MTRASAVGSSPGTRQTTTWRVAELVLNRSGSRPQPRRNASTYSAAEASPGADAVAVVGGVQTDEF